MTTTTDSTFGSAYRPWDALPEEMAAMVLGFAAPPHRIHTAPLLRLVCRRWAALVDAPTVTPSRFVDGLFKDGATLNLLEWALSVGAVDASSLCSIAARYGPLELLVWARGRAFPWDSSTFVSAAEGGRVDILDWLFVNGCPLTSTDSERECCSAAALGGHMAALSWLHGNHFAWDARTCAHAASGGHMRLLKWARRHGCPWNADVCAYAARVGHLPMLKWARKKGCPWDERVCRYAKSEGHLEVVRWAEEQRKQQGGGAAAYNPFTFSNIPYYV